MQPLFIWTNGRTDRHGNSNITIQNFVCECIINYLIDLSHFAAFSFIFRKSGANNQSCSCYLTDICLCLIPNFSYLFIYFKPDSQLIWFLAQQLNINNKTINLTVKFRSYIKLIWQDHDLIWSPSVSSKECLMNDSTVLIGVVVDELRHFFNL